MFKHSAKKRQIKVGKPNWKNRTVFHGDNLDFLRAMNSESVDLIATDPPFNKSKDFHITPDKLASGGKFQDRWSWDNDVHEEWVEQIEDDWPEVWEIIDAANAVCMKKTKRNLSRPRHKVGSDMGAFLCFMAVRLLEMRRILKPTGSLYLHCDYSAGHWLKTLLDAIFGRRNFHNEIVWCYKDVGGGRNTNYYKRKHDIIFWYSKDKNQVKTFDLARGPLSDTTLDRFGPLFNANGVITYRILRDNRPDEFASRRDQGRVPRNLDDVFLSKDRGRLMEDYWTDINPIRQRRRGDNPSEPYRYPTQKPLALYERLIKSTTERRDIVLDPFAGCATTCVAAERLGRKWVGIDLWEEAKDVVIERLEDESGKDTLFEDKVRCTDIEPERTDNGVIAVPYLPPIDRITEPLASWQKLSKQEIVEALAEAQSRQDGLVVCAGCGREMELPFMDLDHKEPRDAGGANDISNRILLCRPCNSRKSDQLTIPGLLTRNRRDKWMRDENRAKWASKAADQKYREIRRDR